MPTNMRKMRRFGSSCACACAMSRPSLCSPLKHFIMTNVSVKGSEGPDHSADAQADLSLRCPHIPEDTFSHGAAHLFL